MDVPKIITLLDLFSGVGGFPLGLRMANIRFSWLGASEIHENSNSVYRRHFPEAKFIGAVESVETERIPHIKIATFGFPCQDLSVAGRHGGIKASRSGLFFEAMRIIRATKPDYFIFENVKGLLSSNDGKDFDIVLKTIADIGYDGQWQLLNSSWFLPQNRERIYFVGYPRGNSRPEIFPLREYVSFYEEDKEEIGLRQIATIGDDSEATRVYDIQGLSRTIKDGGGMGAKTGLYQVGDKVRRLTPLECERVQGFPDSWTTTGIAEDRHIVHMSDAQRHRMVGNAVSPPVVCAIAEVLREYL